MPQLLFGERPEWLGGQEYALQIKVEQLGGATEGTPVRLNGVEIGRVGSLRFEDPTRPDKGVSIIALIKKRYFVPSGARAVIYEAELGDRAKERERVRREQGRHRLGPHGTEQRGPERDPRHGLGDHQRLAEPTERYPEQSADNQHHRDLDEELIDVHRAPC